EGQLIERLPPDEWQDRRRRLVEREGTAKGANASGLDTPSWHEANARTAEYAGDWFAARWHLDRLAALGDGRMADWRLHARRARALADLGRLDEADAAYGQALRRGSKEELADWYRHCAADCEVGERWLALRWYLDRAIVLDPTDWRLYEFRARAHGKL